MGVIDEIIKHPEPYLFNYWNSEVIRIKRNIQISFIELGRALYNIKKKSLFKYGKYKSFKEYLENPRVEIKYSTAMQIIRVYKKFIIEIGVPEELIKTFDYYKLDILIPIVKKNNYEKLLSLAAETPRKELREKIKNILNYQKKEEKLIKKTASIKVNISENQIIIYINQKKYNITQEFIHTVAQVGSIKIKDIKLERIWKDN